MQKIKWINGIRRRPKIINCLCKERGWAEVVHVFNPSTQKAEIAGSLSSKPVRCTEGISEQVLKVLKLQRNPVSHPPPQKKREERKKRKKEKRKREQGFITLGMATVS